MFTRDFHLRCLSPIDISHISSLATPPVAAGCFADSRLILSTRICHLYRRQSYSFCKFLATAPSRPNTHYGDTSKNKLQKLEDVLLRHMLASADLADRGDIDDRGDMSDRGDRG